MVATNKIGGWAIPLQPSQFNSYKVLGCARLSPSNQLTNQITFNKPLTMQLNMCMAGSGVPVCHPQERCVLEHLLRRTSIKEGTKDAAPLPHSVDPNPTEQGRDCSGKDVNIASDEAAWCSALRSTWLIECDRPCEAPGYPQISVPHLGAPHRLFVRMRPGEMRLATTVFPEV